jgi:hypothetical protein
MRIESRQAAQMETTELPATEPQAATSAASTVPTPPPDRRGRPRRVLAGLVVLAVVLVIVLAAWAVTDQLSSIGRTDHRTLRVIGGQPPAGVDAAPAPLGVPEPTPQSGGTYKFVRTQPGNEAPVAYDPCRPIHVVVNSRTAPPGADGLLADALSRVSRATGLQFVVDGPTAEVPSTDRPGYQPDRYPGRWAPVLVAWSDPAETPQLAGDTVGLGGSSLLSADDGDLYVSGRVILDGPELAGALTRDNGPAVVQGVLQHELGHLVGLDHVDDPGELMNPSTETLTDFGPGDLRGLALLGQGRCFPDV